MRRLSAPGAKMPDMTAGLRETSLGTDRALRLQTADGVGLAATYLAAATGSPAVVVGHGFTNSTRSPTTGRIMRRLRRGGVAVLAADFRGHGGSGGRSSVGRDETLDLDAAVAYARESGHARVAVLGFSMGAGIAVRHAAIGQHRADAVVSVSAPPRWYLRDTVPMRRVHWLLEHPLGPTVARLLGVRVTPPWPQIPATPLELISLVPGPLLLVHGTKDHYFGPEHGRELHASAPPATPLWLEKGMGHAESGTSPQLVDRILAWILDQLGR